jgi:hypothetical protein
MTQETNAAYLELHTQFTEKNSQSFVSNDLGYCCCCMPLLDATSFENGYPTTEEFLQLQKKVCNSCKTCISHTISPGTTKLSEIVLKVHFAQPLKTCSLLTTECTNSSLVG